MTTNPLRLILQSAEKTTRLLACIGTTIIVFGGVTSSAQAACATDIKVEAWTLNPITGERRSLKGAALDTCGNIHGSFTAVGEEMFALEQLSAFQIAPKASNQIREVFKSTELTTSKGQFLRSLAVSPAFLSQTKHFFIAGRNDLDWLLPTAQPTNRTTRPSSRHCHGRAVPRSFLKTSAVLLHTASA